MKVSFHYLFIFSCFYFEIVFFFCLICFDVAMSARKKKKHRSPSRLRSKREHKESLQISFISASCLSFVSSLPFTETSQASIQQPLSACFHCRNSDRQNWLFWHNQWENLSSCVTSQLFGWNVAVGDWICTGNLDFFCKDEKSLKSLNGNRQKTIEVQQEKVSVGKDLNAARVIFICM